MSEEKQEHQEDFVLIGDQISDGVHQVIYCKPDFNTIELGFIKKVVDGQSLYDGDLIKLTKREDAPGYHIQYIYTPSLERPAMVNSTMYKSGWENIWGKKDLN